jgi:hypothetical protein
MFRTPANTIAKFKEASDEQLTAVRARLIRGNWLFSFGFLAFAVAGIAGWWLEWEYAGINHWVVALLCFCLLLSTTTQLWLVDLVRYERSQT